MTVSGLPAGAHATLAVDPVGVPGNRTLTVNASGATPGTHVITIRGDDETIDHASTVQLDLADQVPGRPVASLPAKKTVDVPRSPTLEWTAATEAIRYTVEVATDAAFGKVVYSAETATMSHRLAVSLDPLTTYRWRVRATNPCGTGLFSTPASFTTRSVAEILLVDDDDNSPDVREDYTTALIALDRDFDIWDTNNTDDEPSASALGPYRTVIWFTGGEYGGASWLESSRCLLISSQDYSYDRGPTGFMTSHLGMGSTTIDIGQIRVNGLGSYAGLGPYTFSFPYTNWTDRMVVDASAGVAFQGNQGVIGIEKDGGVYRTAFWGFGLETLPTTADRNAVLGAFLGWCDGLHDANASHAMHEND